MEITDKVITDLLRLEEDEKFFNMGVDETYIESAAATSDEVWHSNYMAKAETKKFPAFFKIEKTVKLVKVKNIEKTLASKSKTVSIERDTIELQCFIYIPLDSRNEIRGYGFDGKRSTFEDCVYDNVMEHDNILDVIKDDLFLDEFDVEKVCHISNNSTRIGRGYSMCLVIPDLQTYNLEFFVGDNSTNPRYSNSETKHLKDADFVFCKKGTHIFDASHSNNYKAFEKPKSKSYYDKWERTNFIPEINYSVSLYYKDNDLDEDCIKSLFSKIKQVESDKKVAAKTNPKKVKKPNPNAGTFQYFFILLMEHQLDKLGVSLKNWQFHIGGQGGCIRKECSEPMIERILEKEDLTALAAFIKKRMPSCKIDMIKYNWNKNPKIQELIDLL
jgi:hypothetical protein